VSKSFYPAGLLRVNPSKYTENPFYNPPRPKKHGKNIFPAKYHFEVTDPNGQIFLTTCLTKFSIKHNIPVGNLTNGREYRGYKVKKINKPLITLCNIS